MLSKTLSSLTASDVAAFVDAQPPESETLEFKQQLPAKGNDLDPWERGGEGIGETACNKIMEEVIAFANAHGGHVLLGIVESKDHPKRAAGVHPLPRCHDLASRLSQQAEALIDPQLPVLEVCGVATQDDGAGIVILRVPESPRAPHQFKRLKSCTIRRADRCVPLTMREIQDLTLQRAAAGASLDAEFSRRRGLFTDAVISAIRPANNFSCFGVRVTALPTVRVNVPRAELTDSRKPWLETFDLGTGANVRAQAFLPWDSQGSRPIVRGRRWTIDRGSLEKTVTIEATQDGSIEYLLVREAAGEHAALSPGLILAMLANILAMANAMRRAGNAPGAEYAVELEVRRDASEAGAATLTMAGFGDGRTLLHALTPNPLLLPRYSFGSVDDLPRIVGYAASDLFAAAGVNYEPEEYCVIGPQSILDRIAKASGEAGRIT